MSMNAKIIQAGALAAIFAVGMAGGAQAVTLTTSLDEGAGAGPNPLLLSPSSDFVDIDIDNGDSASYLFEFIAPSADYPQGGQGQASVAITTEFLSEIGPSDLMVGWSNGESEIYTDATGAEIPGADFLLTNSFAAGETFNLTVSFSGYNGDATAGVDLHCWGQRLAHWVCSAGTEGGSRRMTAGTPFAPNASGASRRRSVPAATRA